MGVGPWGGGGSGDSARRGRDGGEELRHVKKIGISGGNPSKFAPYARDHRSKLRRCEPRSQASKWVKGAAKERVFGDKQRMVVKVMVT